MILGVDFYSNCWAFYSIMKKTQLFSDCWCLSPPPIQPPTDRTQSHEVKECAIQVDTDIDIAIENSLVKQMKVHLNCQAKCFGTPRSLPLGTNWPSKPKGQAPKSAIGRHKSLTLSLEEFRPEGDKCLQWVPLLCSILQHAVGEQLPRSDRTRWSYLAG